MILITGANGFIGSMILRDLATTFPQTPLVAVDTVSLQKRNLIKDFQQTKFFQSSELWNFLNSTDAQRIQWVIHMGACSSTTETNWDFLKQNNVEYSQRIFSWCAEHGKGLIYASSAATYGDGTKGFDDQKSIDDLQPLNLYGKSKQVFDQWVLQQTKTPPNWYGLKFFNVYGPQEDHKDDMASVAFKAFHQIRRTGELGLFRSYHPDYKDGEQKRDFVYVKDITRWTRELMSKKPKNDIYNMGSGAARTWLDLANSVFKSMEMQPRIKWLEMPDSLKNQYQYFTEASMQKWADQGLSAPQWSLEKGVDDYVRTYLRKVYS